VSGTRYPDIPLADAAKAIRADIKTALADGTLAGVPVGAKVRVRCERASLMTAVNIHVDDVPQAWGLAVPERRALETALTGIAQRHYADGSGSYISVYFHRAGVNQ
jgi:hypothetical protein